MDELSLSGWFSEKLRQCLIEQVCQGNKVLNSLEDGIMRYIRTDLYLFRAANCSKSNTYTVLQWITSLRIGGKIQIQIFEITNQQDCF